MWTSYLRKRTFPQSQIGGNDFDLFKSVPFRFFQIFQFRHSERKHRYELAGATDMAGGSLRNAAARYQFLYVPVDELYD